MTAAQDQTRMPVDRGVGTRRTLAGTPQRLSEDRRRTKRRGISLAVLLVLLGAAGAVYLSTQGQVRVDVVALAHPVHRGQIIAAEDLATVQVGVDGGLVRMSTPAGASQSIVGRAALLDLPKGQLVSPELFAAATPVIEGTVTVGVRLSEDALPAQTLRAGEWVSVVRTDSSNGNAREVASRAMVVSLSGSSGVNSSGSGGDLVVHLAIPVESADAVAGAASVNGGVRLLGVQP